MLVIRGFVFAVGTKLVTGFEPVISCGTAGGLTVAPQAVAAIIYGKAFVLLFKVCGVANKTEAGGLEPPTSIQPKIYNDRCTT